MIFLFYTIFPNKNEKNHTKQSYHRFCRTAAVHELAAVRLRTRGASRGLGGRHQQGQLRRAPDVLPGRGTGLHHALSLPGIYSPESAANHISQTLKSLLEVIILNKEKSIPQGDETYANT